MNIDEQFKSSYLFVSMLLSVTIAEVFFLHYTKIDIPALKPAVKENRTYIRLSSVVTPSSISKAVREHKKQTKPAKKLKHEPKPKQKAKPKSMPNKLQNKIVREHRPVQPPAQIEKLPKKPAKIAKRPSTRPLISAQKVDKDKIDKAKAAYLVKIREKIKKYRYYPRAARKLHQTGVVEVKFTILKDGYADEIEVVSPSRFSRLNRAAIKTLEKIGRFDPLPDVFKKSALTLKIPINYLLEE